MTGTIVAIDLFKTRPVRVNWDNGTINFYSKEDLTVLTNTPITAKYEQQPLVYTKTCCSHHNKRKVNLIYSSYMYCPDCKQDLGDAK